MIVNSKKDRHHFPGWQRNLVLASILALLISSVSMTRLSAQEATTPTAAGFQGAGLSSDFAGDFSVVYDSVDRFWLNEFRNNGIAYRTPGLVLVEQPTASPCGVTDPMGSAFYCFPDATIYLGSTLLQHLFDTIGDYAPIVILAHEWGHHVQNLTTTARPPTGNEYELQADCLAGVYTKNAELEALLDPGDVSEAVQMSAEAGDEPWWPQDAPGAHGTNDQRITAFMNGYTDGIDDCHLAALATTSPTVRPAATRVTTVVEIPQTLPEVERSVQQSSGNIMYSLPGYLPLSHSSCFRIESETVLTFDDLVARLGGSDDARNRMLAWGWQARAGRIFACDTPPDGDAGWVDVGLHLFGSAASAREAVDYFAAQRAAGSPLFSADPPGIGDYSAALTGPASNGKEFTLYVSNGPLLIRVTAISPSGIPFINALAVAQALVAMPVPTLPTPTPWPTATVPPPLPTVPPLIPTVPVSTAIPTFVVAVPSPAPSDGIGVLLPGTLALEHSACFRIEQDTVYDFATLIERFPGIPSPEVTLQNLGWQEGVFRQFICDAPPAGRVGRIDISLHRFKDAASAIAAASFYASARAVNTQLQAVEAVRIGDSVIAIAGPTEVGREYTLYVSSGPTLLRVTGIAPEGDPRLDVEHVMLGLLSTVLMESPALQPTVPLPTATVTPQPLPTATQSPTPPTPTALPTATPFPTATPMPVPTATATPQPLPTPAPEPTATPRVVVAPVPTLISSPVPTLIALPTAEPQALPAETPTNVESSGCTLVELYPGYPGYRGYVTGVDGPGEVACLEGLMDRYPRFDRGREDAANFSAAQSLGLRGDPEDWTWENWMAIEAERGLLPICYSCLFAEPGGGPERQTRDWDSADARLGMGGYDTAEAISLAAANAGLGPNSTVYYRDYFGGDDGLRAFVGLTWLGHHTAPDMLEAYDILFSDLAGPGMGFINMGYLWESVLAQGGYAPTPPTASIDDQMYMVRKSVEAGCAGTLIESCTAMLNFYDRIEAQFRSDIARTGPDVSYADWLRSEVGNPFD